MKLRVILLLLPLLAAAGPLGGSTELAPLEDGFVPLPPLPVSGDLQTAKNALEAVEKFIEIFNSDVFETTPVKPIAEILSKIVSFIGSIINLVNGEVSESAEIKFMREQFKEVHAKLDSIDLKLDDVKSLIEWQSTRNMYAEFEIFIQVTSRLLDSYVTAPPNERDIRKRQFVTAFQEKRLAAQNLYQAIAEKDFIVAENLAAAAIVYTQRHRRKVMNFLLAMNRVILRGAHLEIAYERLQHGENAAMVTESDWKIRMEKLVTRMKEFDQQVADAFHEQMELDVDKVLLEQRAMKNEKFSPHLYAFLAEKFHWRHWIVVAYQNVDGYHLHAVSHCGGAHRWRTHGDRNLVVASANPKTTRFTQAKGDRQLALAAGAGHGTTDAKVWLDEINSRVGSDCEDAAFRAVICWGCDVWYSSRSDRYSYRKISSGGDVNAILFG